MPEDKENDDTPEQAWDKREFAINRQMREMCQLGIQSTEAEIKALRKRLQKLQRT